MANPFSSLPERERERENRVCLSASETRDEKGLGLMREMWRREKVRKEKTDGRSGGIYI